MLNPVNQYAAAFPILEFIHLLAILAGVGTAALVNFRLLGCGFTQRDAVLLWRHMLPWTLGGLTLAILTGLLLFSADPSFYLMNPAFRAKMLALLFSALVYFTIVRRAATLGPQNRTRQLAAGVSLVMWASVPIGGIFIGFSG